MDDQKIIELYFGRDENAIAESRQQYGRLLQSIIGGILRDPLDAEECENDTYMQAWRSIPPNRPRSLMAFLAAIARNTAINRYKYLTAEKRSPGVTVSIDELSECISDEGTSPDDDILRDAVNGFLGTLDPEKRRVFLLRYWRFCPIEEIAVQTGCSDGKIRTMLHRLRKKLKDYLTERGLAP